MGCEDLEPEDAGPAPSPELIKAWAAISKVRPPAMRGGRWGGGRWERLQRGHGFGGFGSRSWRGARGAGPPPSPPPPPPFVLIGHAASSTPY